jgi:hypothetical protein
MGIRDVHVLSMIAALIFIVLIILGLMSWRHTG